MNPASFWSQPYSTVRRSALIRAEDSRTGYGDFERFSVVAGSLAHSHAVRHLPREVRLQFTSSIGHGVESLLRGETDAIGTGSASAFHQASGNERLKVLDLQRDEDTPELISFSIRREQALLDAINDFIQLRGGATLN
jgi:ABC-type amino acid transport substrate-binding protein